MKLDLNKISIRTKLYSGFVFISILATIIGLIGYFGMNTTQKTINSMASVYLPSIEKIARIQFLQADIKANQYALLNTSYSPKDRKYQAGVIQSRLKEMDDAIKSFDSLPKLPEDLELWKSFVQNLEKWKIQAETYSQYYTVRTSLMEQGVANTDDRCTSLDFQLFEYYNTDVIVIFALCETGVQNIVTSLSKRAIDSQITAGIVVEKSTRNLILIVLGCVALAIFLGIIISKNIDGIVKSVNKQINYVVSAIKNGILSTRADVTKTNFEFRDITIGFNETIEAIVKPLYVTSGYIEDIGKGIIPSKISDTYNGDFDTLKNNINHCIDGLQGLVEANFILQKMAVNDYSHKIEGSFLGIYSDVCSASNVVRDRVLHVIEISQRISNGDLSDREELIKLGKRSENDTLIPSFIKMMTAINDLILDTNNLASAAVDGKLTARADISKHQGDYARVIKGVNDTLDAVVGPLTVAADYVSRISIGDMPPVITDKYNGDFNLIINNLNVLINALNEIIAKAKLVESGDLTVDMKKRSEKDELMQSLTGMVKSTANIISEFQIATNNISASSQQMSSTSQQMSQGASEQASSAEEVSSSMEEMAANIQQNTENAQQTEKIALNAADGINNAAEGSQLTLKYMQEIADKVSIIGEIARQTNILALNAAVEAARAGEYGKGFAVVAAEVRKLAERSQISAVEIDTLTKTSLKATEEGGKMLTSILPEISKTAKLVQEIAAASSEQNSGADQVNNAIQQLNQVTQQNAAASEEMATSSEELSSQAKQLMEMISFFKIDTNESVKRSFGMDKSRAVNHAARSSYKPIEQKSGLQKGININMKKENLDTNYEKF